MRLSGPKSKRVWLFAASLAAYCCAARADDNVVDWNATMRQVIQAVPAKANPGLSTRALAMMNGAIYDVYQAFDHTYQPFLVNNLNADLNANRDAAVAQAARDVLNYCYGEASSTWLPVYNNRINAINDSSLNIANGAALGAAVAQKYIENRATDGFDVPASYPNVGGLGHWTTDPYFMTAFGPAQTQTGWGPGWGNVKPWTMTSSDQLDSALIDHDGLNLSSTKYATAYNQVLNYGAKDVYGPANTPTSRTATQTEIGKFWGYDVPSFGPPPVLFSKNLEDIQRQTHNTPAQNARLFAMASVAMADAAIASWDVKFEDDFWRPVTAIHAGDIDGNAATAGDADWQPLGAPGHGIVAPDFTPPFPAYTSGHATMGGALFKAIQMFYDNKNNFGDIIGNPGAKYYLTSDEPGGGQTRLFSTFTESDVAAMGLSLVADSPEGENAISRIFLGIHWYFDATDGIRLGSAISQNMMLNAFHVQNVPEPTAIGLALLAILLPVSMPHRRRK